MFGQRFDLAQPGIHILVNLPRFAKPSDALLRLAAQAERFGSDCADLYFIRLNITGQWLPGEMGLQFSAKDGERGSTGPQELVLGGVRLKVVRAVTRDGFRYLNIYVHDLALSATPSIGCRQGITLYAHREDGMKLWQEGGDIQGSGSSVAEALMGIQTGKDE